MKTNTDKTNPHAKSISFDSHTNPVLTFIRGECTAYSLYIKPVMDVFTWAPLQDSVTITPKKQFHQNRFFYRQNIG